METVFIGNLPLTTTENEILLLFQQFTRVGSVRLVVDKSTGRSRGFGFVEVEDSERSIEALNEFDFGKRALIVKPALARGGW